MRDFQKQRVYDWEDKYVGTEYGGDRVEFDNIQSIIDHVWKEMGLEYPPIAIMFRKNAKKLGTSNRTHILFPQHASTWIILHEMAHSMTSDHELGSSDRHGPRFVGVYMKLLEKFMNIPSSYLWWSATESGVKFDRFAKPVYAD